MGCAAQHIWGWRGARSTRRATRLRGKSDRYTGQPLLENPATQRALEAAEGLWFAAARLREALTAIWADALAGNAPTAETAVNARVATVTATQKGAEIVRAAYDAAGASAIRRGGVPSRAMQAASRTTSRRTSPPWS